MSSYTRSAVFIVMAMCLFSGCSPPEPGPTPTPSPAVTPIPVLFGYTQLLDDASAIIRAIDLISDAPVKVAVHDDFRNGLYGRIRQWDYEFTDVSPDVIVSYEDGPWDASARDGYTSAIIRFGLLEGVRSVRKVEISDRWSGDFSQYFPAQTLAPKTPTRIVALGHMRGLIEFHSDLMQLVAEAVNTLQPDLIYMLGDMALFSMNSEYDQLETNMFSHFLAPFYYAPGNHEARALYNWTNENSTFVARGYPGSPVSLETTDYVNLVTLDSCMDFVDVEAQLTDILDNQIDSTKDTWLLTHHKVWLNDPGDKSPKVYPYFIGDDIMPLLEGKVSSIITGDWGNRVRQEDLSIFDFPGYVGYRVGSGEKGDYTPLIIAQFSIGEAGILRLNPVYIDVESSNEYYWREEPIVVPCDWCQ